MNTAHLTSIAPSRRLLAGLLVVCMTLAAVPALAHCCADRCHEPEPAPEPAEHCECELSGVEPPVDLLPLATDPDDCLVAKAPAPAPADPVPPVRPAPVPPVAAPEPAPDRTTVLLI